MGSFFERVGSRELRVEPLDVIVKAPGVEHSNRFVESCVEILRLRLDPRRPTVRELIPRGARLSWHRGGRLARRLTALAAAARSGEHHLDLMGEVIETLEPCAEDHPAGSSPPGWIEGVEEAIADRLGETLRVRELAAEAGRHPVHLARVFRRIHGVTVSRFIRRKRVQAAVAAMRTSDHSMAWIAAEYGFADQAHLCRSVRGELGLPPSRLRALSPSSMDR